MMEPIVEPIFIENNIYFLLTLKQFAVCHLEYEANRVHILITEV